MVLYCNQKENSVMQKHLTHSADCYILRHVNFRYRPQKKKEDIMTFLNKQVKNITKQKNMRAQADRQNPFQVKGVF